MSWCVFLGAPNSVKNKAVAGIMFLRHHVIAVLALGQTQSDHAEAETPKSWSGLWRQETALECCAASAPSA